MIRRLSLDASPDSLPSRDLRVLVFGLGRFGGGVGATRFFCDRGCDVTVTDLRSKKELADSVAELERSGVSTWRLGEHREEDFRRHDWVVVNPAIPPNNGYLEIARRAGAYLVTEIGLFLRWCPSPYIAGITGTNGKSTTSRLLFAMLQAEGLPVHLGGEHRDPISSIRGRREVPMFPPR